MASIVAIGMLITVVLGGVLGYLAGKRPAEPVPVPVRADPPAPTRR